MQAAQENQLIGRIYEAALNAACWPTVLSDIVTLTGSTTAIFTATDQLSPDYDFVYTHNIPPESMHAYQDEQVKVLDMRLHTPFWAQKALGDTVLQTFAIYASMPKDTDHYIFYEKCARPTNITHVAAVLLERSAYSWAVFAVHRSPQLNEYSDDEASLLRRLGVHLRRALQIYRHIRGLQQDKKTMYHVLDHLKLGVILVNHDYQLYYTNALAIKIFEETAVLTVDKKNRLKTLKCFEEKLNRLIRHALFEPSDLPQEAGGVVALHDQHHAMMVSVLPFCEAQGQLQPKKAMLLITPTHQPKQLASDYLVQRYQLTQREINVCELFINGLDIQQIAAHLNITYGSVRVYIKHIFAKTLCQSQAELMQLLMGITIQFEHIPTDYKREYTH